MKKSIYYNLIIKILLLLALIISVISCSKVVSVNHTEEMIRDTIINYKLVPLKIA